MQADQAVAHFEECIDRNERKMIRAIARIIEEPHDAEDALQNALTTIWRKLANIQIHPNPEAIVLRMCIDAAYDVLRRRDREKKIGRQSIRDDVADSAATPLETLSDREGRRKLLLAIRDLPRNQSLAVHMRFVEELSYTDLARGIGCAESTARKHVERGVSCLRQCVALSDLNS